MDTHAVIPLGPPGWRQWYTTIDLRIREFATVTLPGLPQPVWSDEALDRVESEYSSFFPTMESVTSRANRHTTDLFVTWFGVTYIERLPGMEWFTHPHAASTVYTGFGPALRDPHHDERTTYAIELVEWAAQDGFDHVRRTLEWERQ